MATPTSSRPPKGALSRAPSPFRDVAKLCASLDVVIAGIRPCGGNRPKSQEVRAIIRVQCPSGLFPGFLGSFCRVDPAAAVIVFRASGLGRILPRNPEVHDGRRLGSDDDKTVDETAFYQSPRRSSACPVTPTRRPHEQPPNHRPERSHTPCGPASSTQERPHARLDVDDDRAPRAASAQGASQEAPPRPQEITEAVVPGGFRAR